MKETLVMLKPHVFKEEEKIFRHIDRCLSSSLKSGFWRTESIKLVNIPGQVTKKLLGHILDYDVPKISKAYADAVRIFAKCGAIVRIYRGRDEIVEALRSIRGPTDPVEANHWQIRGMFTDDTLEKSRIEGRMTRDVIHVPDSEKAEYEVGLFRESFPGNFRGVDFNYISSYTTFDNLFRRINKTF